MSEESPSSAFGDQAGLVGRLVDGRYRVTSELGRGGMGSVFLATDEKMQRKVVLKVPDTELLRREGFRRRFELEIRSLIDLSHPHIVPVLDGGTLDGVPYIVLQYLSGGSLEERIEERGGCMAVGEVLAWLPDVARTLDFIHGLAVVHRDVKPANILFDEHGNVFLADFGIVKALGAEDSGITRTGTTPGTPTYMSPEAAMAAPVDGRSDQYALGGVVYRAIAGKTAIEGSTPYEVMVKKHTEEPVPLATAAPHVGEGLSLVVMRALSRQPQARFPTCVAFSEAFSAEASGGESIGEAETEVEEPEATGTMVAGSTVPRAPSEEAALATPIRHRRLPLAVIGAAAVALAAGAWLLLGGSEPEPGPGPEPEAAHSRATLVVEEPVDGAITNAVKIAVRGRVESEGAVSLLINGGPVDLEAGRFEAEVDAVGDLRFEVRDGAGRTLAATTRSLVVDRTPPRVSIDPVTSPVGEPRVLVSGRIDEPGCAVTVKGGECEVRGTVFEAKVDLAEGPNEITVVARDPAGNATSASVTVVYRPEASPPDAPANAVSYTPETRRKLLTLAEAPRWGDPSWSDLGTLEIAHEGTGLTFVLVPGGAFRMGSDDGADDERPMRRVVITAFLLARSECTQSAWGRGGGENDSGWRGETLPVENVSWVAVERWCGKNGLRLPSEAEWEYACRAESTDRWCFGSDEFRLREFAWFQVNSDRKTHPVGQKRPNRWGLFDTHGNVWEWCADKKSDSYSVNAADGRAYEGGASQRRVLRGGCWYVDAEFCRSARRNAAGPGSRSSFNGFRPAMSLPE